MMFKLFVSVVIVCLFVTHFIIFAFTGMVVLPFWFFEVLLGFFWFLSILGQLNNKYCDISRPESDLWKLRPLIPWIITINVVTTYLLRFLILPAFTSSIVEMMVIAYFGSLIFTVVIPMEVAKIVYPLWEKRQESEQFDPQKLKEIALKSQTARHYSTQFPHFKTYVFDYAVRNDVATCLFLHRRDRFDRPGMQEDITLEIPIDLKQKIPLENSEKISRYVFHTNDTSSSVLQIPDFDLSRVDTIDEPLDSFTLDQFDTLMSRFPSLVEVPFSLALRDVAYKVIESEVSRYRC